MPFFRLYKKPEGSFFLFGPRGVGKSTFIRDQIKPDLTLNLLDSSLFLELKRNPALLESKISGLKRSKTAPITVCIDEIQKIPLLLDEVHRLIEKKWEKRGGKGEEKGIHFILTGSSARKLKRSGSNLLGGRAQTRRMFPFSLAELGDALSPSRCLEVGTLPVIFGQIKNAEEALLSYVDTYLKEEIREEAITRNLEDFVRFLEVSAQMNGRVINFERVGSETGKSGDTIKKWYSILEETFQGMTLPSFRPGFKVREVSHSKFYYFDPGVARAAAGLIREPLDALTKGFALETLVLNELRIYNEVSRRERNISFYGVTGSDEIDFIVETQKKTIDRPGQFVSIECKASERWNSDYEKHSRSLYERSKKSHKKMLGVYLGKEELRFGDFHVLPLKIFVEKLHKKELF